MSASRAQQGPPSALWTAADKGDEAAVRLLLRRRGVNLEAGQGGDYGTALCAAAKFGHSSVVELLLRAGANINAQHSSGATPLYLAAESGQAAVVRTLIAAGAALNVQVKDSGFTPLLCAARFGTLEVVQVLIEAGADIHSTGHNGTTVLHMAARSNEPGLIPYLLGAGAGCHLDSKLVGSLSTPLMVACSVGSATAVERLLEAGAEVGARTVEGGTALQFASYTGRLHVVELLLAAGADARLRPMTGAPPSTAQFNTGMEGWRRCSERQQQGEKCRSLALMQPGEGKRGEGLLATYRRNS